MFDDDDDFDMLSVLNVKDLCVLRDAVFLHASAACDLVAKLEIRIAQAKRSC